MSIKRLLILLLLMGGCSENPLDPDDTVDPEAFLLGDETDDSVTCDDVCDKFDQCFEYDRSTCEAECQQATPEQRQAIVDSTCEKLIDALG